MRTSPVHCCFCIDLQWGCILIALLELADLAILTLVKLPGMPVGVLGDHAAAVLHGMSFLLGVCGLAGSIQVSLTPCLAKPLEKRTRREVVLVLYDV